MSVKNKKGLLFMDIFIKYILNTKKQAILQEARNQFTCKFTRDCHSNSYPCTVYLVLSFAIMTRF